MEKEEDSGIFVLHPILQKIRPILIGAAFVLLWDTLDWMGATVGLVLILMADDILFRPGFYYRIIGNTVSGLTRFIIEAISEISLKDIAKVGLTLLVLAFINFFRELSALTLTVILILAILIPERQRVAERVWGALSPKIDQLSFAPESMDLAERFSSSTQTLLDGWRGFRRSLLSVFGLLMVVIVIDLSLFADQIAKEHMGESLTGQEQWDIYIDDSETGATMTTYSYKKLPPFSGPQDDLVHSSPTEESQMLQLDVQRVNGENDNDGDLITNFLDTDDDNDGIVDFMDFIFPMDFDEDTNSTCDREIWFDNSSNTFCGPDWADLDDDGDGIPDYDEASDGNPYTNIYDTDNDGIQDGSSKASGGTAYLMVNHDTGADPSTLGISLSSVNPLEDGNGTWNCTGCEEGILTGENGDFSLNQSDGNWVYDMSMSTVSVRATTSAELELFGTTEETGVIANRLHGVTNPTGVLVDGDMSTTSFTGVYTTEAYIRDNTSTLSVKSVDATTVFKPGESVYDSAGIVIGTVQEVTSNSIKLSGNIAVGLSINENLRRGHSSISVDSIDATTVFSVNERVFDDSGDVIGIVESLSSSQINLTGNIAVAISDNSELYAGQTTITVENTDATTVFSVNERVFDDSGNLIGFVESVTTDQINLTGNIAIAIPENLNLHKSMSIDGVNIRAGDMVLVRNQSEPSDNSIYVARLGQWDVVQSAFSTNTVTTGMYVWVEEGDSNGLQMFEILDDSIAHESVLSQVNKFEPFSGEWSESFLLSMTSPSGNTTDYWLNFSIQRLSEAPISPNPLTAPISMGASDEWYAIEIPESSHLSVTLSVPSGSDYNLFLYGKRGNDLASSRLHNGCPDFYSYDWIPGESFDLCPMGTTHTGSDMLSKILYGSRKSLRVGFVVAFTTGFFGLFIGGVSGYFGGWIDEFIMRVADVFFAIPGLILAMAVVAALDGVNNLGAIGFPDVQIDRLEKIMIALIFTGWPGYSRLIRGQVLYVKEHTYVEAAKSVGAGDFRILFRHVLPNAWAPMLVAISLDIGGTILTAAGLSFIGLGAEALSSEWGKMISDGRAFFPTHWWMVTFPGLAILVTTLGFNLLGDGLRDVFDPRQRRSKS